jgi:antitoxin (DNA-binding transcriptional repressor) of toxin-antitoxin stability system
MVTVMEIDTRRLIGVTQARQQLSSLLDDVAEGKPFHLMRENTVIAHLVPARALIVNNSNLESTLVLSVILETARRFAQEVIERGYCASPGDDIGRVLGWLWDCDRDKAVRRLAQFGAELSRTLTDQQYSAPTFHQLWDSLSTSLGVSLSDAGIDDFESYARQHLADYDSNLFSASELAGGPLPSRVDDPWPSARGAGQTKRRWCHLEAGQMIPDPTVHQVLPSVDQWFRIDRIDGATAVLRRPDGSESQVTVDDVATWIPVCCTTPYRWGYEQS